MERFLSSVVEKLFPTLHKKFQIRNREEKMLFIESENAKNHILMDDLIKMYPNVFYSSSFGMIKEQSHVHFLLNAHSEFLQDAKLLILQNFPTATIEESTIAGFIKLC